MYSYSQKENLVAYFERGSFLIQFHMYTVLNYLCKYMFKMMFFAHVYELLACRIDLNDTNTK